MRYYRFFLLIIVNWSLNAQSGFFFVGPEPDRLEDVVVQCLDKAQQRIWVAMYQLTSAACVHALVRARRRGVDVQLVLDRGMCALPVYSFVRRQCAGANIPIFWLGGVPIFHHKWALIDNFFLFGSANWTRCGLTKNCENFLRSHDEGTVRLLATYFRILCRRSVGILGGMPTHKLSLFFIPDQIRLVRQLILAAINGAQKSIAISMYAFTSSWCMHALSCAALRGVSVRVILEESQVLDKTLMMYGKRNQVQIKLHKTNMYGGVLHHKNMIIDVKELFFGSMNWTRAGNRCNYESFMAVIDGGVVTKAVDCFNKLWAQL